MKHILLLNKICVHFFVYKKKKELFLCEINYKRFEILFIVIAITNCFLFFHSINLLLDSFLTLVYG